MDSAVILERSLRSHEPDTSGHTAAAAHRPLISPGARKSAPCWQVQTHLSGKWGGGGGILRSQQSLKPVAQLAENRAPVHTLLPGLPRLYLDHRSQVPTLTYKTAGPELEISGAPFYFASRVTSHSLFHRQQSLQNRSGASDSCHVVITSKPKVLGTSFLHL